MATKRLVALLLACVVTIPAQSPTPLTIDAIMQGPQFYGYAPQDVRWSGDGQRIYFRWKQTTQTQDKPFDTWVVPRASGTPRLLTDDEAKLAPPADRVETRDHSRAVYTQAGDLFLYDYATDKATQLTKTADVESAPRFTQDERRVAFTRAGNLYVMPLGLGPVEQLTEIGAGRTEPTPADPKTSQGTLQLQESALLTAVRERVEIGRAHV